MTRLGNETPWVQEVAAVVAAPACPHYIPQAEADGGADRCDWCSEKAVVAFGQFGKSGPTSRKRTTSSDPAGKGHTKRQKVA